jgi:hypothetical protein
MNYPAGWKGRHTSHLKDPKIILEVIGSNDLWIWQSFFGLYVSHNKLNVLSRLPLFARIVVGDDPPCNKLSMTLTTRYVTILQMAYILDGPRL